MPARTHSYIAHAASFAIGFLLPGPIIAKCAGVGRKDRWRGRVWKVLRWTYTLRADSADCPEAKARARIGARGMNVDKCRKEGARQNAKVGRGKSLQKGLLPIEGWGTHLPGPVYTHIHTLSFESIRQLH